MSNNHTTAGTLVPRTNQAQERVSDLVANTTTRPNIHEPSVQGTKPEPKRLCLSPFNEMRNDKTGLLKKKIRKTENRVELISIGFMN